MAMTQAKEPNMSKHSHHKPRHFDFAETRAAESRKMARRMTRAAKESWLSEAMTAR